MADLLNVRDLKVYLDVDAGTVKAVDPETRRATVDLSVTAEGAKVLGRCTAIVQLD